VVVNFIQSQFRIARQSRLTAQWQQPENLLVTLCKVAQHQSYFCQCNRQVTLVWFAQPIIKNVSYVLYISSSYFQEFFLITSHTSWSTPWPHRCTWPRQFCKCELSLALVDHRGWGRIAENKLTTTPSTL